MVEYNIMNFYKDMKDLGILKKEVYLKYVEQELTYEEEYEKLFLNEIDVTIKNRDKIKEIENFIVLEGIEENKKYLKKVLRNLYNSKVKYNLSMARINKRIRKMKEIEEINKFINDESKINIEISNRNKKIKA